MNKVSMKKYIILLTFIVMGAFLYATSPNALEQISTPNINKKMLNLKLDRNSTIKIAEIILCHIYGEKVLNQRPWNVKEKDESFIIEGRLPENMAGGTAIIEISKKNGRVLNYSHSK